VRCPALPPGWRVVALEGGWRDATPSPPDPTGGGPGGWLSQRSARPARAWFGYTCCVSAPCALTMITQEPQLGSSVLHPPAGLRIVKGLTIRSPVRDDNA